MRYESSPFHKPSKLKKIQEKTGKQKRKRIRGGKFKKKKARGLSRRPAIAEKNKANKRTRLI